MRDLTVRIDALRKKAAAYERQARALEERHRDAVSRPILRQSVGECFVFNNSYGTGCERWPLYAMIVSFNEADMTFETVQFQRSTREQIEIELEVVHNYEGRNYFRDSSGWRPITKAEFNDARNNLLAFVNNVLRIKTT